MQVTRMEYVLLWATYLAIMYSDLESGIGAGIVMATLYFAYSYAQARPPQALGMPGGPPDNSTHNHVPVQGLLSAEVRR